MEWRLLPFSKCHILIITVLELPKANQELQQLTNLFSPRHFLLSRPAQGVKQGVGVCDAFTTG